MTFYLFAVARISVCFVDLALDISVLTACKQIYFVMLERKKFGNVWIVSFNFGVSFKIFKAFSEFVLFSLSLQVAYR